MWMNLSDSRWICVLTLAAVMLLSASEVGSLFLQRSCCKPKGVTEPDGEVECEEQREGNGCKRAFMIWNNDQMMCVKPTPPWLKRRIDSGNLSCKPLSERLMFFLEDLDDVDDVDDADDADDADDDDVIVVE